MNIYPKLPIEIIENTAMLQQNWMSRLNTDSYKTMSRLKHKTCSVLYYKPLPAYADISVCVYQSMSLMQTEMDTQWANL